jgi:hypothetical protein
MTAVGCRIIFLHVRKTGGNWPIRAMKAAGVELHNVAIHADLASASSYDGRYRIAFVREPLSWYRSW